MHDSNLTDREMILAVDNDPKATPRERDLADRLMEAMVREARKDVVKQGLGLPSRKDDHGQL